MDKINLKVKLYLENEEDKFMGIGVLWLLQGVERFNSLRAAANDMGISYSKAHKMIVNLETALGQSVLERQQGGSERVGARLTDFGKNFIIIYDEFQKKCKSLLDKPFEEFNCNLQALLQQ